MYKLDIEIFIKAFAKHKRINQKDFPAFRAQILSGLDKMGLGKDLDIDKYKEVVYGKTNKDMHLQAQAGKGGAKD